MTFYYILWFVFYVLGVACLFSKKKIPSVVIISLLIVVAFCVGFRVDVGSDWEGYVSFYNTNTPPDGRDILEMEPLYRLSRNVFFSLGLSYQFFFFVFSFISMYALIRVAKSFKVDNTPLVLLVYISLSFCAFQLNLMRIGIMCSCVWIALSYRSESLIKTLIWLAIGTGFHFLCLAIAPIALVSDKNISLKWFIIIICISLIALLSNIGIKIVDSIPYLSTLGRASDYLDPDSSFRNGRGITVGLLFNIFFCTYLRIKYKGKYENESRIRILINMMLGAIVFASWFNGLGIIAQRGGQCMNVSLCFVWAIFLAERHNYNRIVWVALLSAYLLFFYMKNFSSEGLEERNIVPYKIENASIIR